MTTGGLLAIFAHPDDETFGVGGTMAQYVQRGLPVTSVCATRGEAGEIAPGTGATPETLGEFRERELREACAILGVTDVRFLSFRDSGMDGSADNDDPRSLHRAEPDRVVEPIVRAIRELRPAVIATWDSSGGYGHPDHIAVHRHATAAYHAAADPVRWPEAGEPWRAPALFYNVIPVREFARLAEELRKRGIDLEAPGGQEALLRLKRVEPNCIVDVRAQLDLKLRALLAHRTQIDAAGPLADLPPDLASEFFGREYFYRASPPLPDGAVLHDLLDGID